MEEMIRRVNGIVWGLPAVLMIMGCGALLTVRTKGVQVRRFRQALCSTIVPALRGRKRRGGTVSQFEAFATAISGTVGTGNIIGVISAILTGGAGAVFWMWVSAFFGMVTGYSENLLGIYFRRRESEDGYSGGAFMYIENGLGRKGLALFSALSCVFASFGMSGVQANKIASTLSPALSSLTGTRDGRELRFLIGSLIGAAAAVMIFGGIKRIGRATAVLVPVMSVTFILLSLTVIGMHIAFLPAALRLIFTSAFSVKAAGGGIMGIGLSRAVRTGMARGVFSNEAGLGSSVIAGCTSDVKEPVQQGFWGIFQVFFDTFVICTLTALSFLTAFDPATLSGSEQDTALALKLYRTSFGSPGTGLFMLMMTLFAFTTVLTWAYYGQRGLEYLLCSCGRLKGVAAGAFRGIYILLIPFSAAAEGELIWQAADIFNGLMALPNILSLTAMSGLVVRITENYFLRKKGSTVRPMLSAYEVEKEADGGS
ncbi:MAG: alanine:cation symporter family protein [Ruminococcus sp.]|nr:alanine:cation symporter family protein [Ruminococcus sp.]